MKKWRNLYEFSDGYGAMYNMKNLMLQQLPHLMTVMPEEREREVFQLLVDREVKEGNKKLFKLLLNKAYRKEVQIAHTANDIFEKVFLDREN